MGVGLEGVVSHLSGEPSHVPLPLHLKRSYKNPCKEALQRAPLRTLVVCSIPLPAEEKSL